MDFDKLIEDLDKEVMDTEIVIQEAMEKVRKMDARELLTFFYNMIFLLASTSYQDSEILKRVLDEAIKNASKK